MIGQHVRELKEGDRFYYENATNSAHGTQNSAFTAGNSLFQDLKINPETFSFFAFFPIHKDQLTEIKKMFYLMCCAIVK